MAISLKHKFTLNKADGTDNTVVQPSDWNDDHQITAAPGKVLGTRTDSTTVTELPIAVDANGNAAFGNGTGYSEISINGGAGSSRNVVFRSGTGTTSVRWIAGADGIAESGGNVGSDYVIARFNDSGVYVDTPFAIYRSTGETVLSRLGLGTDLAVIHGGTGASDAAGARANLGAAGLGANTFTGQQRFDGGVYPFFTVAAQGGVEGGEFYLAKPASGTSLAGDVALDIAENKFRVYENGGTYRGVYVDLGAQGSQSRLLTETDQTIKAWVNINPYPNVVIRASSNVSSITDNGTGRFSVNFTSWPVDANYSAVFTAGLANTGTAYVDARIYGTPTAGTVSVMTTYQNGGNPTLIDPDYINCVVAR